MNPLTKSTRPLWQTHPFTFIPIALSLRKLRLKERAVWQADLRLNNFQREQTRILDEHRKFLGRNLANTPESLYERTLSYAALAILPVMIIADLSFVGKAVATAAKNIPGPESVIVVLFVLVVVVAELLVGVMALPHNYDPQRRSNHRAKARRIKVLTVLKFLIILVLPIWTYGDHLSEIELIRLEAIDFPLENPPDVVQSRIVQQWLSYLGLFVFCASLHLILAIAPERFVLAFTQFIVDRREKMHKLKMDRVREEQGILEQQLIQVVFDFLQYRERHLIMWSEAIPLQPPKFSSRINHIVETISHEDYSGDDFH